MHLHVFVRSYSTIFYYVLMLVLLNRHSSLLPYGYLGEPQGHTFFFGKYRRVSSRYSASMHMTDNPIYACVIINTTGVGHLSGTNKFWPGSPLLSSPLNIYQRLNTYPAHTPTEILSNLHSKPPIMSPTQNENKKQHESSNHSVSSLRKSQRTRKSTQNAIASKFYQAHLPTLFQPLSEPPPTPSSPPSPPQSLSDEDEIYVEILMKAFDTALGNPSSLLRVSKNYLRTYIYIGSKSS